MLGTRSCSISPRRTPFDPTNSWPQTSSNVRGRIRSANGAALWNAFVFGRFGCDCASVEKSSGLALLHSTGESVSWVLFPLTLRRGEASACDDSFCKIACADAFRADVGWKRLGTFPFWDDGRSEEGSPMKLWQLESIWSLIFSDGTGFPQMGQDTILSGPSRQSQSRIILQKRLFW